MCSAGELAATVLAPFNAYIKYAITLDFTRHMSIFLLAYAMKSSFVILLFPVSA